MTTIILECNYNPKNQASESKHIYDSLAIATAITISFLFLPAIIELKKPKDAGPRLITQNQIRIDDLTLLADIEETQNTN